MAEILPVTGPGKGLENVCRRGSRSTRNLPVVMKSSGLFKFIEGTLTMSSGLPRRTYGFRRSGFGGDKLEQTSPSWTEALVRKMEGHKLFFGLVLLEPI